ncbi:type VI secretion system protein TssA [Inquilinus sp. NPDC058860]|uniref:type VI secretion system protein TssA n=1 Tax=Inquilinus sp. NPDC058860 TaxID=3346652 RepID=UPI0036CB94A9
MDALAAPIPGDRPAGENLRLDISPEAPFQRLKDMRAQVRALERAADAEDQAAPLDAEWRPLVELAGELLATRSKDLEVASVLVEGLVRLHGFAGLRDGFRILHRLLEDHWDDLHPTPDDDGIATRLSPLIGLNGEGVEGTLIQPIRKIPLVQGPQGSYALWQIIQAGDVAAMEPDRRAQRVAAGALDLDEIVGAARAMGRTEAETVLADIDAACDAFQALSESLDARCGPNSPPTSHIRNALTAARDAARLALGDGVPTQGPAPSGTELESVGPADGPVPVPEAAAAPLGTIRNRDDALRLVEIAAAWFRRMEPHSPISYTLEDAVRRARMVLPDLIAELIRDDTARRDFLVAAGIQPRGD